MKLSTSQIDAFLALQETLRFTVAAERCHVSTSAFSQIINRIEQEVDAKLFDRSTRHVALTPEGEVFALALRRVAAEIDAATGELRARKSGQAGLVSIAATPTPWVSWLPKLLQEFSAAHPRLKLRLRDGVSDLCFDMLNAGVVELAITAQAGEAADFESTPLFDEKFSVLCGRRDPLARLKEVKLADLKDRDFIDVTGKGDVWEQRRLDLRRAGVRDTGLEVANFGTLVGLISAGFGIGLVPRMALPLCQRDDLVNRPLSDPTFVRRFYLVQRTGRTLSFAAERLAAFIQAKQTSNAVAPVRGRRRAVS